MLEKITNQVGTGQDFLFYDFLMPMIIAILISSILGIMAIIIIRKKKSDVHYIKNNDQSFKHNPENNEMSILKERLAKGEITKEEYDTLKKEFE